MAELDLVGVSEIAERAGVSIHTVYSWRKRKLGFPDPVSDLRGLLVWEWVDVEAWLRSTGRLDR